MVLHLKGKSYELSTSLRVVYALRDITHAGSLQEAMGSISKLDLDGKLDLLYAAYRAANREDTNALSKSAFIDEILDSFGIFAITDAINKLTDGLLYSGLTPEEIESKKAEMEAAMTPVTATTGVPSSVEDTN